MTNSKLRRPNWCHSKLPSSSESADIVGSIAAGSDAYGRFGNRITTATSPPHISGQLATYTRRCHAQLLAERDNAAFCEEDEGIGANQRYNGGRLGSDDAISTLTNDASKKKHKGETTSMEQCIVLLEPSLEVFRSSCVRKDKVRDKKSKSQHIDTTDIEGGDNIINNIDDSEDDEVPPQMLRLARFFQFRWLPVKRALLRPPPSPAAEEGTSASNNDASSGDIEVSIHYRLRLARACWKKGLVAAAEYESLKGAFDCRGEKRKRSPMNDGDIENGGQLKGQYKSDDSGTGNDNDLMERVRLSLMRLPTDAIQPESERSTLAMRHVKEMILEYCRLGTGGAAFHGPQQDCLLVSPCEQPTRGYYSNHQEMR